MTVPDGPARRFAVLWLYGADAVGKSAVGWEVYTLLADAGEPVAHVGTDYQGFCTPAPADQAELVARNLAGVWDGFAATGARLLVVSGIVVTPEDRDRFEQAIPEAGFTFCRLTAQADTVWSRIVLRREVEERTRGRELAAEVRTELEPTASGASRSPSCWSPHRVGGVRRRHRRPHTGGDRPRGTRPVA